MLFQRKGCSLMYSKMLMIALFACTIQAMGQNHVPDMTIERDFVAQVKSMDEFMARFNGEEVNPELHTDSVRRDNIIALFDYNMSHNGMSDESFKNLIREFTISAINSDTKLSITSAGVYAEAKCLIKYAGKKHHVTLMMVREETSKGGQRWAINSVSGLEDLGLYNEKRVTISPVDHEIHFMSLQDFFQENRTIVPSMRSKEKGIDEMSMFFGLCLANAIEFEYVDELKFHISDVPGFVFIVEEIGREGTNSGWLITSLYKTDSEQEK